MFPPVGPAAVAQALEFQVGVHIGQAAIAVIRYTAGIEQVPAGGEDDVADLDRDDLIFLVEIDGIRRAELLAGLAGTLLEVGAIDVVDHRVFWHGLRERCVNSFAIAETGFKLRR